MKPKYEVLEWDSNFFGLKVCRLTESNLSNDELINALKLLSDLRFDLIYYSNENRLDNLDSISEFYEVQLVDKKTTYIKTLSNSAPFQDFISEYNENYVEEKLIALAIESGVYSRFNVDANISKEKYRELYSLWIINSVNKKLAKTVLVSKSNNEITGFVTLGEKNARADIGIIAVDAFYRGKGIGKSLMYAAEKWFGEQNYNSIQVVTQGDNKPACQLYEGCGFHVEKMEYFYHLWKK